ncbi:MAG: N-acetylmuramoyl-L-alanine amidase [Chitinophagaceae bacterium]|nr:MAG: N-acetylmuramoyl-L-alanine amidase [Chitinophagaceae bacterium]
MLKKTLTLLACFLFGLGLLALKKPQPVKTVIIDAGHGVMAGGGYNGARGSYSYEDDICYAIAKKLVAQIKRDHPEIRIVETRPTRNITDLRERANIANREKGDLFISIHVNAMDPIRHREQVGTETEVYYTGKGKKRKKHTRKVPVYRTYTTPHPAKGTQTYIWGVNKAGQKEVAVRENAQMYSDATNGDSSNIVDVDSPEFMARAAVQTKQFWVRSAHLADFVEAEFGKVGRVSQGSYQRQVGIWVLQATAMPSVLVETGFITNKEEEDYLNSESGQQEVAECISRALGNYMEWVDKNGNRKGTTSILGTTGASAAAFLEQIEKQEQAARHGR